MSKQIVGVQRVFETRDKGARWNNKKIRWTIVQNQNNQTKNYDIQLQMVLISSKRIVKVNGQQKDMQMCSFGYQSKFQIDEDIEGYIRQNGLGFQLFVNGTSFTKLQMNKANYQPPKLTFSTNDSLEFTNPFRQQSHFISNIQPKGGQKKVSSYSNPNSINNLNQLCKKQESKQIIKSKNDQSKDVKLNKKPTSQIIMGETSKKQTFSMIKSTQEDLMKILIQEKKKKKQLQKLKANSTN